MESLFLAATARAFVLAATAMLFLAATVRAFVLAATAMKIRVHLTALR